MGEFSIWHWLVVLLIVLLLFGGGKVSGLMGDFAKGIKAFKKGLADEEPARTAARDESAASISGPAGEAAPSAAAHEPATSPKETTPAH